MGGPYYPPGNQWPALPPSQKGKKQTTGLHGKKGLHQAILPPMPLSNETFDGQDENAIEDAPLVPTEGAVDTNNLSHDQMAELIKKMNE